MKFLFLPFSIVSGLIAGKLASALFGQVWGVVGGDEPPEPKHREIALGQLALALIVEGAIFKLVKGLTDHGARHAFARATGEWPGEERPEPE